MRRFKNRQSAAAALVLGTVGAVLILLSTGPLASGQSLDRSVRSEGPSQISNPHDVDAQNAPDAVVQGRVSFAGIDWTASTYTNALGHCLSIGAGGGSVGGCGSGAPLLSGIGSLTLGSGYYVIVYGFAPPRAASARVDLADGSLVPPSQSYIGSGIWFVVYRATEGAASGDPTRVALVDSTGKLIDSVSPPSFSAYDRAAQSERSHAP